MNKYTSGGFRSVTAEDMKQAAQMFADRAARHAYGRKGYTRTCTLRSYAEDGSLG